MTTWPPHPEDEWIDVTPMGKTEPVLVLGRSGAAAAVAKARDEYLAGQIDPDELEARIHAVLFPQPQEHL